MSDRYEKLREEYEGRGLDDVADQTPWSLFERWQKDAEDAPLPLANAMALATADESGAPSVRMVLLKNVTGGRLWFFTDKESQKGRELGANPRAEVLFYWQPLHRQIRVHGEIEPLSSEESDAYFASRPRSSNLSAMASHQSQVVPDGTGGLEAARASLERELDGRELVRPERWGGFALVASRFEFWQGRPDRLHHRLRFLRADDGSWSRHWLAP